MSSKCPTCQQTVYFNERLAAMGKDWHPRCFKCTQCKKVLQPGSFSEHDQQPYCGNCHKALFSLKGYGYGGTLASHAAPAPAAVSSPPAVSSPTATAPAAAASPTPAPAATMSAAPAPAASSPASAGPKFCAECGTRREPTAKFCAECGARFT